MPSTYCRPWSSPWAAAFACGAASTFWKATARITPRPMLMCGKVTHKKLKDNQLTIPCLFIAKVLNLQFDLDKLVYYTYSVDRVEMTNNFQ